MYFWKVDDLVKDFKSGNVSQKEELKYLVVFTVAMTIFTDPFMYLDISYNFNDTLITTFVLIISVYGLNACYKINALGDDKDYMVRMMCIGLPVLIRTFLFVLFPLLILVGILEENVCESVFSPEQEFISVGTSIYMVIAAIICITSYFFYLATKIRAVSTQINT